MTGSHVYSSLFVAGNEVCEPLQLHTSRSWVIAGISWGGRPRLLIPVVTGEVTEDVVDPYIDQLFIPNAVQRGQRFQEVRVRIF